MQLPLQVQVADGFVAGRLLHAGSDLEPVRVWKGIPYAAAPIGELRWRPPVAPAPWPGVMHADAFAADCPQAAMAASRAPATGEDCLALNVWAPSHAAAGAPNGTPESSERWPVMVWLHGGGFVGGSGADARCDGAHLARRGVVVVTFNYRSGLFGFLAHPTLSAESPNGVSGNYGLLDQLCALRWVQDNIGAFGGDRQRVTVFGVSAGSASISLLMTSPLADGLFQQAILHSPGAARPLASLADAEQAGMALGPDVAALRRRSAAEISAMTPLLTPKMRGLTTPRVLRPIRDGWVLPEDERPAFKAGRLRAMPVIVGTNADEGTLLTASWPVDSITAYRATVDVNFSGASSRVFELYPAHSDDQAHPRIAEIFADTQFNYGARLLAEAASRCEPRTWYYLYVRRRPGQNDGPHHGEEVGHVFGNLAAGRGTEAAPYDAVDEAVSAAMMGAWVAFACGGDPNASGLPSWPQYSAESRSYLRFGNRIETGQGWRTEQLDFLDAFYEGT